MGHTVNHTIYNLQALYHIQGEDEFFDKMRKSTLLFQKRGKLNWKIYDPTKMGEDIKQQSYSSFPLQIFQYYTQAQKSAL